MTTNVEHALLHFQSAEKIICRSISLKVICYQALTLTLCIFDCSVLVLFVCILFNVWFLHCTNHNHFIYSTCSNYGYICCHVALTSKQTYRHPSRSSRSIRESVRSIYPSASGLPCYNIQYDRKWRTHTQL